MTKLIQNVIVMSIVSSIFIFAGAIVYLGEFHSVNDSRSANVASEAQQPIASEPRKPDDIDRIYAIGKAAVNTGLVTEYEVSGWNSTLDLTVSSLLPDDARTVADAVCMLSQQQFAGQWKHIWKLQVFILTSGDRPAAVCNL